MKVRLIVITGLLLLLAFIVKAQDTTIYFNADDRQTSRDSAEYYLHFVRGGDNLFSVEKRKLTDNKLLSKGYCITPDSQSRTGSFVSYSESGLVDEEGTYANNKREGIWKYYTDSGKLSSEGKFINGKKEGLWKYYYENSKQLWYKVDMVADVEDGTLQSYYKSGKLKRVEQMDKGATIGGNRFDEEGKEIEFTPFEQMPYPQYSILQYLADHLNYPPAARKNKIEGRVKVNFIVDEMGKLTRFKIVTSLGYGCNEEVLRVMHLMPKWVPGLRDDEPVKVYYTQPVRFKLQ